MSNEEAESRKEKGNALFKEGKFADAIKEYNKAIQLNPDNASYYSNRAACLSMDGKHESALADAKRCLEKDSTFLKGYCRKGKALCDMKKFDEAEAAYKEGLEVEPGNKQCTDGLAAVAGARRASSSSYSSSSSSGSSAGGGIGAQILEKLKNGGKMQTYMMIMAAYMLFNNFTNSSKSPASSGTSSMSDPVVGGVEDDDADVAVGSVGIGRRFKEFDGMWLSYMQSEGKKAESTLLMLHRTSLSAEAEFSSAFSDVAKAVAKTSRVVAPDRPCHGYSPCPENGEPADGSSWLHRLLRTYGQSERIAVLAVGREAAATAFAFAGKRKEVQDILLLSPSIVAPARERSSKADDLHAWLKKNGYPASGQAAADAIRWASSSTPTETAKPVDIPIDKLTQDCKITLLYDATDTEDADLKKSLEAQGAEVKTRSITAETLVGVLAEEVKEALNPTISDPL